MSLLTINSEPAEREQGCVFAENFVNASTVVENGGTITGTPLVNNGAVLNGTTDGISYNSFCGFNKTSLSVVVEFVPNVAYNHNSYQPFVDTTNAQRQLLIVKYPNASNNQLQLEVGDATINIAQEAYGAYWNVGVKNILVVTSTSGNTSAWLNGNQILTSNATAWTATRNPTEFYVGKNNTGSVWFNGTMELVKLFTTQLTDQEALDYSNGGGFWNYENEAVVNLPMDLAHHDPTNTRTLDISGNGYHGAFGASTAAPTKNTTTMGYLFDNTNDYIQISNAGALKFEAPTADFTLSCWVKFPTNADGDCIMDMRDGNDDGWALRTISTGSIWAALGAVDIKTNTGLDNDVWHHVVAPINRSGNSQMYVDGAASGSAVDTSGVTMDVTSTTVTIGNANYASLFYDGNISKIKIWGECLTPMQIKDLYLRELRQINDL